MLELWKTTVGPATSAWFASASRNMFSVEFTFLPVMRFETTRAEMCPGYWATTSASGCNPRMSGPMGLAARSLALSASPDLGDTFTHLIK